MAWSFHKMNRLLMFWTASPFSRVQIIIKRYTSVLINNPENGLAVRNMTRKLKTFSILLIILVVTDTLIVQNISSILKT